MLLEYGFRNFFSFKEGATISFRLPANCPENISGGLSTSPVICIKGANGSGKTQILKALSFLRTFSTSSFSEKPDAPILIAPYFDNTDVSSFYIEFEKDAMEYRYEVEVTTTEIIRETIYRKISKRTKVFEREKNTITYCLSEWKNLKSMKLRSNASVISTAHQYEQKELNEVYDFFNSIFTNVSFSGLSETPLDLSTVSNFLKHHPDVFSFVKDFIRNCDTGISDIEIHERETESGEKEFFPIFYHSTSTGRHPITRHTESSGSKALFRHLALYKIVLDQGSLLILDEFDINLHPDILPKLVELFTNNESNKSMAQMIFTTHNNEILDLLGRYRTYLVNKDENESYTYRLDEIPGDLLRNDRPIYPIYKDGKVGGVPRI